MLFIYVNNSERTSDVSDKSIAKINQIQQRADSLSLNIFQGATPVENQDVRFFNGDTIASAAGAVMTLNGYFERNVRQFYAGQELFIRIGDADEEKVTVLTYVESTLTLTLTAAPSGSVVAGDKIGEIVFGGIVSRVSDYNVDFLDILEWEVECVDYTKIFDKKIVSDTWADVDSRYIINSFVNTTVNYNSTIDDLSYANNAAIQAVWIESSDGGNPTIDSADFIEEDTSGVFPWTFAGGTAIFTAATTSRNLSQFTGVNSGTPTKGSLMLWIKPTDYTKITNIKVRIGSSATDYAEVTFTGFDVNDWDYKSADLDTATIVGTPDWTAQDYAQIRITQTATSSVRLNGLRVNAQGSFTLNNVDSTNLFDDFRSPQLKPTALINILAKAWQYIWFIDYERDIHFIYKEDVTAPFDIDDTSGNFRKLSIDVDQSQLGNRIIVRGGEKTSSSRYAQVIPGDNSKKEWLMKNKFNNLEVNIDDNTITDLAEVGTNTTNIKITAHGLSTGDHVINRTRANAVREITVVDANNFTVETVTSQTNGDSISQFGALQDVGIEGVVDETTVDYVYNSNEKSVRASSQTNTLPITSFIRFEYNERIPIQIQYTDSGSVNALKALGLGDGIFDLDPITDRNIQDTNTAIALAQAKVEDFKNPIITGTFETDQNGLKAGQVLTVTDTERGIAEEYLIQIVRSKQAAGQYSDYFIYSVTFGTTLFGLIEFYQKLLAIKDAIEVNTDDIVETFVTAGETVESNDVNQLAKSGGFKTATGNEIVETNDVNNVVDYTAGTWRYEPNGAGQPLETRFNLADYG